MNFYADEQHVKITGRTLYRNHIRYLGYSATSISFRFTGKQASACLISDPDKWPKENHAWIAVYINDAEEPLKRVELTENQQEVLLYEARQEDTVTVTIMKYSEPEYAVCGIESITIDSDTLLPPPKRKQRQIQIIGDSITCGYGIEGSVEDPVHNTATENPAKAYSVLTARALDADVEIVAWNGKGAFSAYIGDELEIPDRSWLVPMLYEYTDAGCCKQYFHEPQEQWEKWDANQTGWRVRVADKVNQNTLFQVIRMLCAEYDITLARNPSYIPDRKTVMIKATGETEPEKQSAVKEIFLEKTGCVCEFA